MSERSTALKVKFFILLIEILLMYVSILKVINCSMLWRQNNKSCVEVISRSLYLITVITVITVIFVCRKRRLISKFNEISAGFYGMSQFGLVEYQKTVHFRTSWSVWSILFQRMNILILMEWKKRSKVRSRASSLFPFSSILNHSNLDSKF